MTAFLKTDDMFRPHDARKGEIIDALPTGIYSLMEDGFGLYLKAHDPFELPPKLYGDTNARAERILNTFSDRTGNTGVLLTGEKGSGKTLLAKVLVIRALQLRISTILINAPYHGDDFNSLMEGITGPCVMFFDEFEKVYHDKNHQTAMLTFMEGTSTGHRLLLLTCNDTWGVDRHMLNRPGRLYYHYKYIGLSEEFISEYCTDHLREKNHTQSLIQISTLFDSFSFDGLKAIVEECNRYGETPTEVMDHVNIKPYGESFGVTWKASVTFEDGRLFDKFYHPPRLSEETKSPLDQTQYLYFSPREAGEQEGMWEGYIHFKPSMLDRAEADGTLVYRHQGFVIRFTRERAGDYKSLYKAY